MLAHLIQIIACLFAGAIGYLVMGSLLRSHRIRNELHDPRYAAWLRENNPPPGTMAARMREQH